LGERLIIAGSRSLNPTIAQISRLITELPSLVICGCADGVDKAGYAWARHCSVPVEFFPAWPAQREWALEYALPSEAVHACPLVGGKKAGHVRNDLMASVTGATALIYYDGSSPGSKSMIEICERRGIPHKVHVALQPGDTVMAGRKGPYVIQSLGTQAAFWGPDEEIAVFENGEFMAVDKLKRVDYAER
jgi:hypothetical protein